MTTEERRLWDGRPATAPRLAERYWPLVGRIARNVGRRAPSVGVDDLAGWGAVGLMQAIASFDPSRRILPETHLGIRVRGAMLDGLREALPHGVTEERRRRRGESWVRVHAAGTGVCDEASPLAVAAAPPDDAFAVAELEEAVGRFLVGRQRELFVRTLLRGEKIVDVAAELRISQSSASQFLARGERRLQSRRGEFARALALEAA